VPRRGVAVRVEGAASLAKALRTAEPALIKELTRINRRVSKLVADDARTKAPRRSGALQKSIKAGATKVSGYVTAGDRGVPYAGPIHFGWAHRPQPGRRIYGGPIEPNPFLWDALDARRREVEQAYLRQVNELVLGVGRSGAR